MDERQNIGWKERSKMRASIDQIETQLVDQALSSNENIRTFIGLGHVCESLRWMHQGTQQGVLYDLAIIGYGVVIDAASERIEMDQNEDQT